MNSKNREQVSRKKLFPSKPADRVLQGWESLVKQGLHYLKIGKLGLVIFFESCKKCMEAVLS